VETGSVTDGVGIRQQCADLNQSYPGKPVLDFLINTLMTELWDNGFSQSEIRSAFEAAIADMPRYTAGHEKRDEG
jgi:hypothetical protein